MLRDSRLMERLRRFRTEAVREPIEPMGIRASLLTQADYSGLDLLDPATWWTVDTAEFRILDQAA